MFCVQFMKQIENRCCQLDENIIHEETFISEKYNSEESIKKITIEVGVVLVTA